jgi:hypothetical protein
LKSADTLLEPCVKEEGSTPGELTSVELLDNADLVVTCLSTVLDPRTSDRGPKATNAEPDVIQIAWLEGVCGDRGVVEVGGDAGALSVIIRIVKRPLPTGPIPVECPAAAYAAGITLELSKRVDASNVFATRVEVPCSGQSGALRCVQ